jgi:hypothetical protein
MPVGMSLVANGEPGTDVREPLVGSMRIRSRVDPNKAGLVLPIATILGSSVPKSEID